MKRLIREAFRRFDGESSQGIYVLTQAMGGGKTHNMIALGLPDQHPDLRPKVMEGLYRPKITSPIRSDLKATYEGGDQQIHRALENLHNEVGRSAITLKPVGLNTEEIYHILRKRLFADLPSDEDIWDVARGYANAVSAAKQMDITNASPEKFAAQLKESYPFHFAIRDLYARFRENPGFQQTRGLIRLMRVIVSRLFDEPHGRAGQLHLIHAHDLDLNDRETISEILQINPTLDNAISHDIASNGQAISEIIDSNIGGRDARDVCKLLLVSSLANVPNAVLGLSIPEIVSYLCAPGRDVTKLPKDILGTLATKAWYLHSSRG